MSEATSHAPGTFCWPELCTTDQTAAKAFYGNLFGWGIMEQPMGPGLFYTTFTRRGREVAAAFSMDAEQRAAGAPPYWLSYISVENVNAVLDKAQEMGAAVVSGPLDVLDAGRTAVIQDPSGAVVALWQPRKQIGIRLMDETATLVWTELMTREPDKARDFYAELIGWRTEIMNMGPIAYTVFKRGETPAGGMMQMTADMAQIPPHWMPYFGTDNCDAMAAKAAALGGKIALPPSDVPGVGRFSVLQDPQGAAFAILRFQPRS